MHYIISEAMQFNMRYMKTETRNYKYMLLFSHSMDIFDCEVLTKLCMKTVCIPSHVRISTQSNLISTRRNLNLFTCKQPYVKFIAFALKKCSTKWGMYDPKNLSLYVYLIDSAFYGRVRVRCFGELCKKPVRAQSNEQFWT